MLKRFGGTKEPTVWYSAQQGSCAYRLRSNCRGFSSHSTSLFARPLWVERSQRKRKLGSAKDAPFLYARRVGFCTILKIPRTSSWTSYNTWSSMRLIECSTWALKGRWMSACSWSRRDAAKGSQKSQTCSTVTASRSTSSPQLLAQKLNNSGLSLWKTM